MDNETLDRRQIFFPWNDKKHEAWLREMARQGWHLQKIYWPGRYHFEKGAPRDVRYWLDYKTGKKGREDYLGSFEEQGWEHVQSYNGWQIFRKPAAEVATAFDEAEARLAKYRRMQQATQAMFMLYLLLFIVPAYAGDFLNIYSIPIYLILFLPPAIVSIKLAQRIQQLQQAG